MANDFFDKYKAKGGEDLDHLSQQIPPAAPQPAQPKAPTATPQGAPTTFAETAEEKPAAAGTMRFEQDAHNGFSAPPLTAPSRYTPPKQNKTLLGIPVMYIVLSIVAIIAIILAVFLSGRGKVVPAMDGWTNSEVELWATENKINTRLEKTPSDEIAAGTVISQSPTAGERVKKSEFLTLTVSGGPDMSVMVPVPDIMNMSMAEVEAWVKDNFMSEVIITTKTSETVPSGKVIEFKINDNTVLGDEIRRDTKFYVTFSKGKPVGEAIELANFLTMSVDEAQNYATEKELTLVIEEAFSDKVAKGNIISQSTKAGETVYAGASITLVVSKGEEILVPNFFALTRELAEAKATQLGIQTLTEEVYSSSAKDALLSQSIKAGTLYQEDDIVVLKYSKGNSVFIDSYVGQDISVLEQWCEGYNVEGAKLTVNATYIENNAVKGTILIQNFEKQNIGIDTVLELVVSKGKMVIMPSLAQANDPNASYNDIITKEYVITTCESLGLIPFFIEENREGYKAGQVWAQGATAGSEIPVGTVVTFNVVPVTQDGMVTVPSFIGKKYTEAQAEPKANELALTFVDESGSPLSASMLDDSYTVLAQSITAGTSVAPGYAITLTMKTHAPDFNGLTAKQAADANKGFNLTFKLTEDNLDFDFEAHKTYIVSTQEPTAGTPLAKGSNITLTMVKPTPTTGE